MGKKSGSRLPGTLELAEDIGGATIGKLIVSKSFTLKVAKGAVNQIRRTDKLFVTNWLTVHRGATLTLDRGAILYLAMRKGDSNTDKKGMLTVNGAIAGPGQLRFQHNDRPRTTNAFHAYTEYTPAADGSITYEDCIRVTGTGAIRAPDVLGNIGECLCGLEGSG